MELNVTVPVGMDSEPGLPVALFRTAATRITCGFAPVVAETPRSVTVGMAPTTNCAAPVPVLPWSSVSPP